MKMIGKAIALLASLALVAPGSASAQMPPANTGAASNVNALFQDALWEVSTNGGLSWMQAYQVQNKPGVWQANTSTYSWISSSSSGSGGSGNYYFRTAFDLTGYNPSTAAMTFQCAVDNYPSLTSYYSLNGGAYGGSCGSTNNGYQFAGVQTVNSGFVSGTNSLTFHFTGDGITDGLVVGDMTLSASAVTATPEPASLALLATGLVGIVGAVRRRRA